MVSMGEMGEHLHQSALVCANPRVNLLSDRRGQLCHDLLLLLMNP
ncbi:MAG: hypothetical protein OD811_02910 [Alphaproteobacteria bacterium]